MVPPANPLGPVGLILPTLPQQTMPRWAASSPRSSLPGALPATGTGFPDAASELAAICVEAERLGAGALWACDHIFWHRPVLECLTSLTVAATATRSVALGSCVLQLPLRSPAIVAKEAASLQLLSGGRLVLGVGVGSHVGEYEVLGADFATRGRDLDAGIVTLRESWASGQGVDTGDLEAGGAERYRQLPAPPPVPVWVGGSSEAALRRAARLADGWIPLFVEVPDYATALERPAKETDRAGRPAGSVTPAIVLFVSVDDDDVDAGRQRGLEWMSSLYGIPAKAFARHMVAGTSAQVAATVAEYLATGAQHVVIYITADDPLPQFERLVDALGADGIQARR